MSCSESNCQAQGHNHHHHHNNCNCCNNKQQSCCSHQESSCHENFSHQLLELADEAWMEVLKEKIKQEIIASSGKKLEELAKIVSETNSQRWKNKIGCNNAGSNFESKIHAFFGKD